MLIQNSSTADPGMKRSAAFANNSMYFGSLITLFIACSWAAKLSACGDPAEPVWITRPWHFNFDFNSPLGRGICGDFARPRHRSPQILASEAGCSRPLDLDAPPFLVFRPCGK
jgi:hypothetical protein